MTAAFPSPAWLVGCGNMAGAMVEGWRSAGVDFKGVTVIRPSGTPVDGIVTMTDYPDGAPHFVMLGIKPQKVDEVAPILAHHVSEQTLLVSMLAGVNSESLRARFPNARAIVRVMPNLPVSARAGVTALYGDDLGEDDRRIIDKLMASLGLATWCDTETSFSAIGAVAGSGPAYLARFVEAMARGGEGLGLDPHLADAIAIQTLVGTGAMQAANGESMAALARRVASPKGTTEQGLAILDADDGVQALVDRMLAAAIRRGRELAAATRVN